MGGKHKSAPVLLSNCNYVTKDMQGLLQRDMLNSSNDYIRSPLSLIVKSCRHCVLMILMKLCMVDILNYALESEGTWIC